MRKLIDLDNESGHHTAALFSCAAYRTGLMPETAIYNQRAKRRQTCKSTDSSVL